MIFIFMGKSETYFPLSLVEPPIVLPTVEPGDALHGDIFVHLVQGSLSLKTRRFPTVSISQS